MNNRSSRVCRCPLFPPPVILLQTMPTTQWIKIQIYYYIPSFCGLTGLCWDSAHLGLSCSCSHVAAVCPRCFFSRMSGTSPGIAHQLRAGQAAFSPHPGAKLTFLPAQWSEEGEFFLHCSWFPLAKYFIHTGRSCKAVYNLSLKAPECHFHSILLVKQGRKASPDSESSTS